MLSYMKAVIKLRCLEDNSLNTFKILSIFISAQINKMLRFFYA